MATIARGQAHDRRAYAYEPTVLAIRDALDNDRCAALWAKGRGWRKSRPSRTR